MSGVTLIILNCTKNDILQYHVFMYYTNTFFAAHFRLTIDYITININVETYLFFLSVRISNFQREITK